jgi:large subunit ribosomal protein L31
MAKAGIHPDYHPITIVMTDGTRYESRSTYGKAGDTLQLDVDPKTHPAWVGGVQMRITGRVEKFNDRFAGLSFAGGAKSEPKAEAKKDKKNA